VLNLDSHSWSLKRLFSETARAIAQNFERCIPFKRSKEVDLFHQINMTVYEPDSGVHKRRPESEFLISAVKALEVCHIDESQAKRYLNVAFINSVIIINAITKLATIIKQTLKECIILN